MQNLVACVEFQHIFSSVFIVLLQNRNNQAALLLLENRIHRESSLCLVNENIRCGRTGFNYRIKTAAAISFSGVVFTAINPSRVIFQAA